MSFRTKIKKRLQQYCIIKPVPTILNIFTTNRCNFSCVYCSRNVAESSPGADNRYGYESEFRLADLQLLLEKYPSIQTVSFVGIGEPFLVKDLLPMASLAKQNGKYTNVITNGSLLHHYWGRIAPVFDTISISLHGLNAIEMQQTAGVDAAVFKQFEDNIQRLVQEESKLNPDMSIRASVVTDIHALAKMKQAANFCVENHLPELDLHNFLPYGLDDCSNCYYDDDKVTQSYLEDLKSDFADKLRINLPIPIKRDDTALFWGCTAFFTTLRVDGLGNVCGCSRIMVPREENGNFRTDANVWCNEYFIDMRTKFRQKRNIPACCRYCPESQ